MMQHSICDAEEENLGFDQYLLQENRGIDKAHVFMGPAAGVSVDLGAGNWAK